MYTRWPDYPALTSDHVRGARLYADRADQIAGLAVAKGGKVAEVGVWRAGFSQVLIDSLAPRQFFAFDIFTGHDTIDWHGMSGDELFDGLSHRKYYEREMSAYRDVTTIVEGSSLDTLQAYTDRSFDLVYVDGSHDYDVVRTDAALGAEMLKESGFLVFNDYILMDHSNAAYGVVPVVNDLVVNQGWQVVGFALHHSLYCDIALQRGDRATAGRRT